MKQRVHTNNGCSANWLERLPTDASFSQVKPDVDGHDLASVRKELDQANAELKKLEGAPVPSQNIGDRVR